MHWQGAMLARLRVNAGFQAVVGLDAEGKRKAYWDDAPQDTVRPYVTLFDPSEVRGQTLTGWDLPFTRVQIDVWADTKNETIAIMEAALAALVPGGTSDGRTFQRAEIALGPRAMAGEREGNMTIRRRSADLVVAYT